MLNIFEGLGHHVVVTLECCDGITIEGSANFFSDNRQAHVLGMQHSVAIGEMMHDLLRLLQLRRLGIAAATTCVE